MSTQKRCKRERYAWERYWCPRDGRLDLSDGGYLVPPTNYFSGLTSDVSSAEVFEASHVVGLVGEPGIGKSEEVRNDASRVRKTHASTKILEIDLERCCDESFCKKHIENTRVYQDWLQSSENLYIYFENLDRMVERVHLFAKDLVAVLNEAPLQRLFLRIISRTYDWSELLEDQLNELYSNAGIKEAATIFELAPLSRQNVVEAAKCEGIDAEKFLLDLDKSDIVAFAIKPLTLQFLLNRYQKEQELPSSMTEMFRAGCMLLSSESNLEIFESQKRVQFSAKERFAGCIRIASVLIFCQKHSVWTGRADGSVSEGCIPADDLIGGNVIYDGVSVPITLDLIDQRQSFLPLNIERR